MEDIIGKSFSKLKVIKKLEEKNKRGSYLFLCECSCGRSKKATKNSLVNGGVKTCGSKNCINDLVKGSLIGQKFGRLLVLEIVSDDIEPYKSMKGIFYKCICDCGNIKIYRKRSLVEGTTKSCGCLSKESRITLAQKMNLKHGLHKCDVYKVWKSMRSRCLNQNNKNYKIYGGRGIKICDEWLRDFKSFHDWAMQNGYKKGLTLDRINVNGNYEPQNCRWATQKEQMNNVTYNVHYTYNDRVYTQAQLCEEYKISPSTLTYRLKKGWTLEDALLKPIKNNNN